MKTVFTEMDDHINDLVNKTISLEVEHAADPEATAAARKCASDLKRARRSLRAAAKYFDQVFKVGAIPHA